MNVGEVVGVVVGSLIAYIIASLLITTLVAGTSTGDKLLQNIVPIVCAAGACIIILRQFLK